MTFDEVLEQVRELLQSKDRVAYRGLKRRFEGVVDKTEERGSEAELYRLKGELLLRKSEREN